MVCRGQGSMRSCQVSPSPHRRPSSARLHPARVAAARATPPLPTCDGRRDGFCFDVDLDAYQFVPMCRPSRTRPASCWRSGRTGARSNSCASILRMAIGSVISRASSPAVRCWNVRGASLLRDRLRLRGPYTRRPRRCGKRSRWWTGGGHRRIVLPAEILQSEDSNRLPDPYTGKKRSARGRRCRTYHSRLKIYG